MADGSLVLLPTPGHTAGSMSLLVRRTGRPPLLLAGDLTNGAGILQRGQLPGVGSRRQLAQSTRKVLALAQRQPGLVVLPAHDPTAAQRLLSEPSSASHADERVRRTITARIPHTRCNGADHTPFPGTSRGAAPDVTAR